MPTVPSFENVILQIHQSLGLKTPDNKQKRRLIRLEKPFLTYAEEINSILEEIFLALGMDEQARSDAMLNIMEWSNFNSSLERNMWTSGADERQLIWYLFGNFYAPTLGRRVAFWTFHERLDKGMPGGKFWYLPNLQEKNGIPYLVLPVPQVIHWFLDLLGQPVDQLSIVLERPGRDADSIAKLLYNWLQGDVPRVDRINATFTDEKEIDFLGSLTIDPGLSFERKWELAVSFAKAKGLNADLLVKEIPMTQVQKICDVLNGSAPDEDKQRFIELMCERFAPPEMKTVRQRLVVARMMQDGYRRLVKFLLGKEFDETCANPKLNKVLQIVSIFKWSYNLTVEAREHGRTIEEEDKWFDSRISPWDRLGVFLSITPSLSEKAEVLLGERITRRLADQQGSFDLEDLVAVSESDAPEIIKRDLLRLKKEAKEDQEVQTISERMRRASPWRALQAAQSWWAVGQVAGDMALPLVKRSLAVQRMRELASNPHQKLGAICIELGQLLNNEDRIKRPKDVKAKVESLLLEAESNEAFEHWKAAILGYRAKHHLSCNEFESAQRYFKESLEACHGNNFGLLRGEVARDAFALAVALPGPGYNLENYEWCYRNMVGYGGFEGGWSPGTEIPTFEDVAVEVEEYFWDALYLPYPGESKEKPKAAVEWEKIFKEIFEMIAYGNFGDFEGWLRSNKEYDGRRMKTARGDSVLMSWVKMVGNFRGSMPMPDAAPPNFRADIDKVAGLINNMQAAIVLAVKHWPKSVNIVDFKKQSPLMMAANQGDVIMVRALLDAKADAEMQDFLGRTALHAAVASRSSECVKEILDRTQAANIANFEDQTALHTAVRCGHPEIVRLLVQRAPALKEKKNCMNQSPLELALCLRDNPGALTNLRKLMARERRITGEPKDFENIVKIMLG